jgi:hypothetical protein
MILTLKNKVGNQISERVLWLSLKIILVAVFLYAMLRAYSMPLTHDEVLTIGLFTGLPWLDIFTAFLANNHLLNTLIVKLVLMTGSSSELLLRSSALLGLALYLVFIWLLLKQFVKNNYIFAGGILLLTLNPYLLDFFSLERGYGLALGLAMGGLYFVIKAWQRPSWLSWLLATVLLILSITANLAFVNFGIALIATVVLVGAYFAKQTVGQKHWYLYLRSLLLPAGISMILSLFAAYVPIRELISRHELYIGGVRGFWADTVRSLIDSVGYHQPYAGFWTIAVLILVILTGVGACLWLGRQMYQRRKLNVAGQYLLFWFVLLAMIGSIIFVQHTMLGMNVPAGRTALYLLPLFGFLFVALWQNLLAQKNCKFLIRLIFGGLTILTLLHFVLCLNLQTTYDWSYDASDRAVVNDLADLEQDLPSTGKLTLGAVWFFEPGLNYYLAQFGMFDKFNFVRREQALGSDYDYYYLDAPGSVWAKQQGMILLKTYELSNTFLYVSAKHSLVIKYR